MRNLIGTSGNDSLVSGAGGSAEETLVMGLEGDDTLVSGSFGDAIIGGEGRDIFKFTGFYDVDYIEDFEIGKDKIDLSNYGSNKFSDLGFKIYGSSVGVIVNDYEQIVILKNTDLYELSAKSFVLRGADETNEYMIDGNALNNLLIGNYLPNILYGAGGNDTLIGGAGRDVLGGEVDSDVFKYLSLADSTKTGMDIITDFNASGQDKIDLSLLGLQPFSYGKTVQGSLNITYDAVKNQTIIADKNSDFAIVLSGAHTDLNNSDFIFGNTIFGNSSNNAMSGTTGNDVMSAMKGDDAAKGYAGNDILYGNQGNDTLSGDEGNDTLDGGAGADKLMGGAGRDSFRFSSLSDSVRTGLSATGKMDVMTDFTHGEDVIDVSGLGFTSLYDFTIRYQSDTDMTLVMDKDSSFAFALAGNHAALDAWDFML